MKKLLTILLLLTLSLLSNGQDIRLNAIYLAYQPADHGVGLRADHQIRNIELYNSVTYGNWGLYKLYHVGDHKKFSFGVVAPIKDPWSKYLYSFTMAVNYHLIGSTNEVNGFVDPKVYDPWSFELGMSVYLDRFALGLRTDILRWEPCVDIGYRFLLWEQKYKQPCMR